MSWAQVARISRMALRNAQDKFAALGSKVEADGTFCLLALALKPFELWVTLAARPSDELGHCLRLRLWP